MSETTEQQAEVDPIWAHWFEQERIAFDALESGDLPVAIRTWTELLDDPAAVEFFSEDREVVLGIVSGLVEAHRLAGSDDAADALVTTWGAEVDTDTADTETTD